MNFFFKRIIDLLSNFQKFVFHFWKDSSHLYILVYLERILKIARNFYSNLNVECLEMPNVLKELKIFD